MYENERITPLLGPLPKHFEENMRFSMFMLNDNPLKEFWAPLQKAGSMLDRSIPSIVHDAVKEWLEKYHPEKH